MSDHPTPDAASFADELARMVVDAYARRMGEHTGAAAELAAVREALGCGEGIELVEAVACLQNKIRRTNDRLYNSQVEVDGLRKELDDQSAQIREVAARAMTEDEWSRLYEATGSPDKHAVLRRVESFGRLIAEKDAALSAIAEAGLKAAAAVGVERAEDIPAAWERLRAENERLRAELAAKETPNE